MIKPLYALALLFLSGEGLLAFTHKNNCGGKYGRGLCPFLPARKWITCEQTQNLAKGRQARVSGKGDERCFRVELGMTALDTTSESDALTAEAAREELLSQLRLSKGNTRAANIQSALSSLYDAYSASETDARGEVMATFYNSPPDWLLVSAPEYPGSMGTNSRGEPMYTMRRLAFNQVQPNDLVCSVQKITNSVYPLNGEKEIDVDLMLQEMRSVMSKEDIALGKVRVYNIETYFTVDDGTRRSGIKGILTNYGFAVPDPTLPNRFNIWFTGGSCSPQEGQDMRRWAEVFEEIRRRDVFRRFGNFFNRLFRGRRNDVSVTFVLPKPISLQYHDVLYLDEKLRVVKGSAGSVSVNVKP